MTTTSAMTTLHSDDRLPHLEANPPKQSASAASRRDLLLHALFEDIAKVAQISQPLLQKLQRWSTCSNARSGAT